MLCPFCKEEILDGAIKCKHCSSILAPIVQNTETNNMQHTKPIWASVTSLILAALCMLSRLGTTFVAQDEARGQAVLLSAAIGFALHAIKSGQRCRGLAITAIIISILGFIDLF